jgi:hypothetical protein
MGSEPESPFCLSAANQYTPRRPPLVIIFCICCRPKASGVPGWSASGAKEPRFFPFRSDLSDTPPSTPLRRPNQLASLPGVSGSTAVERIQKEIAAAATGGIVARRRESKMEIPVQGVSGEAAVARKQGG